MPFRGISIDDEGSIIYDGEKFIVNHPSKVPDDFDPGDKEVVGLPETHPSHPQNRKPSPIPKYVPPLVIYTAFDKYKADEHQRRVEEVSDSNKSKKKEAKQPEAPSNEPSLSGFLQDMEYQPDISALGLVNFVPLPNRAVPIERAANRPLSEGQKLQINYLLSTEDDSLVSNMLIALKVEGMPEWISFDDYMKRFAEWGWDEESDQRARETWQSIMQDRADASIEGLPVFGAGWWNRRIEETLADQANDTIESLQVIDAATGRVLLNRMGVLGAGGQQYVGLQAEEVAAFQGQALIFVHNHPNGREASEADLRTAFLAGAEMLLVVTPRGYEYVYIRGEGRMVLVREGEGSYEAAPLTAEEYVELEGRSWWQAQADRLNPPEYVMQQEENEPTLEIEVSGALWFYGHDEHGATHRLNYTSFENSERLGVLGRSYWNPFFVLMKLDTGESIWVDLKDQADEFNIGEIDLVSVPTIDLSGRPAPNVEDIREPFANLVRQTVDFLPISRQEIISPWILQFGIQNKDKYPSMPENRHPGLDIFAPAGTEIRALTSGEVIGVFIPEGTKTEYKQVYGAGVRSHVADREPEGKVFDPRNTSMNTRKHLADNWIIERSHRAYVIVRSGNAYILYGHLDPNSIQVGTHIIVGQIIGTVGVDAIPSNDHLHLEVRTHGAYPVNLDETGEYVHYSEDRPGTYVNPLWLFTEELVGVFEDDFGQTLFEEQIQALTINRAPYKSPNFSITSVWPDITPVK